MHVCDVDVCGCVWMCGCGCVRGYECVHSYGCYLEHCSPNTTKSAEAVNVLIKNVDITVHV